MAKKLLESIFSHQEVLISCSSLRTLDTQAFKHFSEETALHVSDSFFDILIENFKKDMHDSAMKVAENVVLQYPDVNQAEQVTQILLNRRYRRGKRDSNNPNMIREMVSRCIAQNKPVELSISLFPCKIPNRLKSAGDLPDLAELASLARLSEIGQAVALVYKPGAKVIVLTDGMRFQHVMDFDVAIMKAYQEQMQAFISALGVEAYIELIDYVEFLDTHLPAKKIAEKKALYAQLLEEYKELVGDSIPLDNPREYVESLPKQHHNSPIVQKIAQLYFALIYCNYYPEIVHSTDPDGYSKRVYADISNFTDEEPEIIALRKKIVTKTWEITSKYVAEIASGRVVKPVEEAFPDSIRCDMHNIYERLTLYSVVRSTPLTAFHGTGFITTKLNPSVRFRVSLQAEGYAPVYGSILGTDYGTQPVCYFPLVEGETTVLPDSIAKEVHLK